MMQEEWSILGIAFCTYGNTLGEDYNAMIIEEVSA